MVFFFLEETKSCQTVLSETKFLFYLGFCWLIPSSYKLLVFIQTSCAFSGEVYARVAPIFSLDTEQFLKESWPQVQLLLYEIFKRHFFENSTPNLYSLNRCNESIVYVSALMSTNYKFFCKQHFNKQHKVVICKKSYKC